MRRINFPIFKVDMVLAACAANIKNRDLAARLVAASPNFTQLELEYANNAANNSLSSFPSEQETNGISQEEMSWLYTKSFSRKNGPTRHIYDALKILAPGSICPLCNQRTVGTLDHHLSKQHHPAFAVTPINMVPACRDCNSDTLARPMQFPSDQTFHPYFDDVDDEIWLQGIVEEISPPVVRFIAAPPIHWEQGKRTKVEHHFRTFNLALLYSTHAGSELQNIYGDIQRMERTGGYLIVMQELAERAITRRRVVRNSWQAAMYSALAQSDWFCKGGFRNIVA